MSNVEQAHTFKHRPIPLLIACNTNVYVSKLGPPFERCGITCTPMTGARNFKLNCELRERVKHRGCKCGLIFNLASMFDAQAIVGDVHMFVRKAWIKMERTCSN